MFLLNLWQEHGQAVTEHAAQAAEHATEAAAHGQGEHIPIIVEKLNDLFGPAIFDLQSRIMPSIYKVMGTLSFEKLFSKHWPGEGLTYATYRAAGNLPLPTHVVMFLLVVFIAVVVLTILRGKLSTEAPNHRQ